MNRSPYSHQLIVTSSNWIFLLVISINRMLLWHYIQVVDLTILRIYSLHYYQLNWSNGKRKKEKKMCTTIAVTIEIRPISVSLHLNGGAVKWCENICWKIEFNTISKWNSKKKHRLTHTFEYIRAAKEKEKWIDKTIDISIYLKTS